jgi:protein gp37
MGLKLWGPPKTTNRQGVKSIGAKVRKLQREARGGRVGVLGPDMPLLAFVGSLMDWAEDHPDAEAMRPALWEAIRSTPEVHFQLLTKRPENIANCLPDDWGSGYPNVWLGTSIEDARVADRADHLRRIPAVVRFISYEPATGPLAGHVDLLGIDWIIYGGESGPGYRAEGTPDDPKCWARDMRDACRDAGVAYFHKQSAAFRTEMGIELDGEIVREFPVLPTSTGVVRYVTARVA